MQYLREFFSRQDIKMPDIPEGIGRFLLWVLLIWCVVALIAILLISSGRLPILLRVGTPASQAAALRNPNLPTRAKRNCASLFSKWQTPASIIKLSGLLLATLKSLDANGLIRFHASKTNGDYLIDFQKPTGNYSDFRTFIDIFEKSIYGRLVPAQNAYYQMITLMKNEEECERIEA